MSEIVLVTGGAGFVGQVLVDALRTLGKRVRSFDLAPVHHDDDISGSINDEAAVARAFQGVSEVYHLAGNAQLWARDHSVFDRVNRQGTETILAAAIAAGVERFVHCSSLTTLVGKGTPIGQSVADETVRLEADDMLGPYPRSKLLAERAVEAAAAEGLNAMIAMPTEPLGPGDTSLTPPTKMLLDFTAGRTPAYIDCVMNFVSTTDLAQGLIAVGEKGKRGERYLLGGENLGMAELLSKISNQTGVKTPKARLPYFVALAAGIVDTQIVSAITGKPPGAPLTGVRLAGRNVSFSSEKASNELGWKAAGPDEALTKTIDWFRAEGMV